MVTPTLTVILTVCKILSYLLHYAGVFRPKGVSGLQVTGMIECGQEYKPKNSNKPKPKFLGQN